MNVGLPTDMVKTLEGIASGDDELSRWIDLVNNRLDSLESRFEALEGLVNDKQGSSNLSG